jgi:precorrin-6B methylase 1
VDAAFHEDVSTGALGVVVRGYQGNFIAAMYYVVPHISSVAMAKARLATNIKKETEGNRAPRQRPKRVATCRATIVEIDDQGFSPEALTRSRYP